MNLLGMVFFCGLLIAAYTDFKSSIIPNWLTYSGAAVGLLLQAAMGGWSGMAFSLLGGLVGFLLTLLLYMIHAVGGGDVKLFMAIGLCTGMFFTLQILLYSILYAGFLAVFILLYTKTLHRLLQYTLEWVFRFTRPNKDGYEWHTFPFMYAVLPAVLTAWWW